MMAAASALKLPEQKQASDNKSKLYNELLKAMARDGIGWSLGLMKSGESFSNLLTNILWTVSFMARCIEKCKLNSYILDLHISPHDCEVCNKLTTEVYVGLHHQHTSITTFSVCVSNQWR